MVSLEVVLANLDTQRPNLAEYRCQTNLDLYDSPNCTCLATQAAVGRQLRILRSLPSESPAFGSGGLGLVLQVCLCEDDYLAWLPITHLQGLAVAATPYRAAVLSVAQIRARLPAVLAFTHAARAVPNHYRWGGTVGPHYDCSGLMQAAFTSSGIWLPRDAYQQEAFAQPIPVELAILRPGDLIFFGPPEKATHVGLYLGAGAYIHSSGQEQGRNGIGIDRLAADGDTVGQAYYRQLRGAGRVVASYQPQLHPRL